MLNLSSGREYVIVQLQGTIQSEGKTGKFLLGKLDPMYVNDIQIQTNVSFVC